LGATVDASFLDKGVIRVAGGVQQGMFARYAPDAGNALSTFNDLSDGYTDAAGLRRDIVTSQGSLLLSRNLAAPSYYTDNYAVGELMLDLGKMSGGFPIALKANAQIWNRDPIFSIRAARPEISGVLDLDVGKLLGPEMGMWGLTVQGSKTFAFSRMPTVYSGAIVGDDIFKTGIGLGLGAKLATSSVIGFGAQSRGDYSVGGYITLPKFDYLPPVMLALQQTFGPGLESGSTATPGVAPTVTNKLFDAQHAGITLQIPFKNIGGMPIDATLEWDNQFHGAIFMFNSVATDISVITSYHF
jgi:hypothetical protein